MTPEIAMEQYVTILSRSIPGCIQDGIGVSIYFESTQSISSVLSAIENV